MGFGRNLLAAIIGIGLALLAMIVLVGTGVIK